MISTFIRAWRLRQRGTRCAAAVLLSSSTLLSGNALSGCGETTAPSVPSDAIGTILNQLTDDVNNVLENGGAQGRATVFAAAAALQAAISQEESAFATDLNKSIEHVEEGIKNNVNRLKALVADFQSGSQQLVASVFTQAQTLLNTIPFSNHNPQVNGYSPIFATSHGSGSTEVHIRGNFFYSFHKNLTPELKIAGSPYKLNINTTNELGFAVPSTVFAGQRNQLARVEMELIVPYEKGAVFKSIVPGVFRLLVTALPADPLRSASVMANFPVGGTIQRSRRVPASPLQYESNSTDCKDHSYSAKEESAPQWTIEQGSAHPEITEIENVDRTHVQVSTTNTNVLVEWGTKSNCAVFISSGSGVIHFYVNLIEEEPNPATNQKLIPVTLGWGDVILVPVAKNQWHVDATIFDGTHFEAADTDHSNPYLKVDNEGANVRLAVPAPEALVEGAAAQKALAELVGGPGSRAPNIHTESLRMRTSTH